MEIMIEVIIILNIVRIHNKYLFLIIVKKFVIKNKHTTKLIHFKHL